MVHVEGLNKRYGERVLFEDVSWHVKKRDRIGLSGPNGAGKTTLLRMLAGLEEPDAGSIRMASDTTTGYLPQDGLVHRGRTVYDEVVLAFQELIALKEEQHRIEDTLATATHDDGGEHEKLLERYAEVTERFKRVAADQIEYGFTIDDPSTWTKPWTAIVPLHAIKGPFFEYACSESNMDVVNIMAGERATEKAREEKAKGVSPISKN